MAVLFLLALPVALGVVGGRCQSIWLTLCVVPAILVSLHVGGFLWSLSRGVTPSPSLMPDGEAICFYCGTALLMLMPAVITHGIVQARCDKRVARGHCQTCGYDLTGNVSGRCPECGTPMRLHRP